MSVTETREYRITCSRQVAEDCLIGTFVRSHERDDGRPRSITAAEDHFRSEGWTLGSRTTCPACLAAWEAPPSKEEEVHSAD